MKRPILTRFDIFLPYEKAPRERGVQMDIRARLRDGAGFTPTEQQLALHILSLGERINRYSIKELARESNASISSVHRLCKKVGLEGYKDFKIALARSYAVESTAPGDVDVNYPFQEGDRAETVLCRVRSLYDTALLQTAELIDPQELDRAADLILGAQSVDIYTQSHNLYPARMFCDRLLSVGVRSTAYAGIEAQTFQAMASNESHCAIAISYSGLSQILQQVIPLLAARNTPIIFIGTARGGKLHPGLDAYLSISDSEHLQNRITQLASHLSVQYVLDALFGCLFARDYARAEAFLKQSAPYTALPGAERVDKEGAMDSCPSPLAVS